MSTHMSLKPVATKVALSHSDYAKFLPLVRRIARRLARRLPSHIELGDLMSLGWLGLAEAISRAPVAISFEEFEAFASKRVKGAMLDYLRSYDPNARERRNTVRRVTRATNTFVRDHGREPNEAEISIAVGACEVRPKIEHVDVDHVNPASDLRAVDDVVGGRMEVEQVERLIHTLPERQQKILSLYYRDECSLKEIGAVLGVTESRISQILTATVSRLRDGVAMAA